jgi:hypothetical protein
MDLQEFVAKTLSQISLGVTSAKMNDERIAPKIGVGGDNPKVLRTFHGAEGVFLVEFDVAATIEKAAVTEARCYRSRQRRERQNVVPKIQRVIE